MTQSFFEISYPPKPEPVLSKGRNGHIKTVGIVAQEFIDYTGAPVVSLRPVSERIGVVESCRIEVPQDKATLLQLADALTKLAANVP